MIHDKLIYRTPRAFLKKFRHINWHLISLQPTQLTTMSCILLTKKRYRSRKGWMSRYLSQILLDIFIEQKKQKKHILHDLWVKHVNLWNQSKVKEILHIDHPQDNGWFGTSSESLYGLSGVVSYQYELRSNEYGNWRSYLNAVLTWCDLGMYLSWDSLPKLQEIRSC